MKKLSPLLFTATALAITLLACRKIQPDFDVSAEDPCDCASEVSADFVIEEALLNPSLDWVETDTTFHTKDVQFRALEENAEYTWYIGIDTFNTQSASRFFTDQWIGFDIPITLVVRKEPNSTCYPHDDGYDSITKTFYVSQYPLEYGTNQDIEFGSIEGTYRMFSTELNDSIDIGVDVRDSWGTQTVNFTNIDGSGIICNTYDRWVADKTYREFRFRVSHTTTSICTGLSGIVRNKVNGEAEMIIHSSTLDPQNNNVVDYTYNYFGRKLD
jgi:hypothetical protein